MCIYQSRHPLVYRAGSGHIAGHLVCMNSAPPAVDRVHIGESIMHCRSLIIIVYRAVACKHSLGRSVSNVKFKRTITDNLLSY